MTRVKRSASRKNKHNQIIAKSKGFRGRGHKNYRISVELVQKGFSYAYRDRKYKKRLVRSNWIQAINAACRSVFNQLGYAQFIYLYQKNTQKEIDSNLSLIPTGLNTRKTKNLLSNHYETLNRQKIAEVQYNTLCNRKILSQIAYLEPFTFRAILIQFILAYRNHHINHHPI
uniref:Ribosomal protein L20 n=1 Tax=Moramonas marocensis TaxID=1805496 RepID=A0A140F2J9_9EUKA|nr:ribosomal protein L20 [Moramonas marocensis]